jgi:hypothetical protein
MNTPVSFEIAKLLKEKGYNQQGFPYYSKDLDFDDIELNHHYKDFYPENGYEIFTAPTIAEVIMWLYENHGIWIAVTIISQESWQCYITEIGKPLGLTYNTDSNSPIEAYEAAIIYTLKNLI